MKVTQMRVDPIKKARFRARTSAIAPKVGDRMATHSIEIAYPQNQRRSAAPSPPKGRATT